MPGGFAFGHYFCRYMSMKQLLLLAGALALALGLNAQDRLKGKDLKAMQQAEPELAELAYNIVNDTIEEARADACFKFIPKLVEALKTPYSFDYPFDSLITISIQYPEDRSFRIFSWQLSSDEGAQRYYGVIQKNTKKGELELYPLFDYSKFIHHPGDTITNHEAWYGVLYYKIVTVKEGRQKYYTLFGWDANDLWSDIKVLEALTFDKNGQPVFGAPIFAVNEGKSVKNRFMYEYKENTGASLNYDEEEELIVFDHLVSTDDKMADLEFSYVPDGTYEGFRWKDGQWVHDPMPFPRPEVGPDDHDNPPVPNPVDFDNPKAPKMPEKEK